MPRATRQPQKYLTGCEMNKSLMVGWVYGERLPTSATPAASITPILEGPNTSLKPMIPIIVGSALGGFLGFLLVVFGGIYFLRRRRSRDVDSVVERAHFPTLGYNSGFPNASPATSAHSQMHHPYTGYSYRELTQVPRPCLPDCQILPFVLEPPSLFMLLYF
ncbi:hypothetical protein RSAG8_09853, partial [Rhizoctonia solani AG-8 WAC10335]